MQPIIVFSHLRWNFVYQRPQHLVSRLARQHPVYFVEEPVRTEGEASLELSRPVPGVTVCTPLTPLDAPGFDDHQLPVVAELMKELVGSGRMDRPIAWLYTPLALPAALALDPQLLVYDCMDELSLFRDAPRQLVLRERALLKSADLVFTGGRSLYRAKRPLAASVHCFPSSVEREHFGSARSPLDEHPEQSGMPRPRLGFHGVIDERLDIPLLASLADAHPEWHIVMVGPVVKIKPESLPVRTNIHYLGQRDYQELPRFLAGWDVCLLPFALNDATRFISPTKTLEYMAAEKPIVSTPVTDVVDSYKDIVRLGGTAAEFIAECERALSASAAECAAMRARMRAVLDQTSWDQTAAQMQALIGAAPKRHRNGAVAPLRHTPIAIIGAGPTGLSAAYHVGRDAVLLEQGERVGGWCRSLTEKGFTFDYAGHIMFSKDPYVHELYERLLGDNLHWQDREAWIWSKGVYTRYPFQGALYGLPHEVARECIVGAIEARFGSLRSGSAMQDGSASQSAPSRGNWSCKAESITDCCADGIAETTLRRPAAPTPRFVHGAGSAAAASGTRGPAYANFEEFIYKVWGRGIARHFAVPYNRKLWAVPLDEMETSWLGGRVPLPDLEEMIDGALRPVARPQGPNARFGYPLRGGFQALMDGFLPLLEGELRLNARIVRILPEAHRLVLEDGTEYQYEQLISTMPLPQLIRAMGSAAPRSVQAAARELRHVSVRCVNLGIGREHLTEKHWIYYPEDPVFHRVFVQGNASPHVSPPGGFGLTCEITYSPDKPLPCDGEALIERCIADCIKVGLIRDDDTVIVRNQVDMPYAYVVYDHARKRSVDLIRSWLSGQDILLAGRYSEWEYYNSDHAFVAGRRAAEEAVAALSRRVPATVNSGATLEWAARGASHPSGSEAQPVPAG